MWEYMELPVNKGDLHLGEQLVERCVTAKMQEYLNDYLAACSAGERHTLFYSRRRGNGPSPHMSAKEVFAAIIRSVTAPGG